MQLFDTMYPISRNSDILRQGLDFLAQWLEQWISTQAIRLRIPSGTWDFFFQTMHHFFVTNFHIRKISILRIVPLLAHNITITSDMYELTVLCQ